MPVPMQYITASWNCAPAWPARAAVVIHETAAFASLTPLFGSSIQKRQRVLGFDMTGGGGAL